MIDWPKHPDGSNKTIGEMTPEESRPLLRDAFLRSKLGQPTPECADDLPDLDMRSALVRGAVL